MRISLTIAYDGTAYSGWQRQSNATAIQEVIENALEAVYAAPISLTGASRTDAGVHALGQRAAFSIPHTLIPVDKIPYVLNARLPSDIVITRAENVEEDFHPRFMAKEKTYQYKIINAAFPDPLAVRYACFIPYTLNYDAMCRASASFIGTHDFAAFCATGGSAKTTVRTIYRCEFEKQGGLLTLTVTGNAFLYNMVRIIVGTLAYVGLGKIRSEDIPGIILGKDRRLAGKTLSAQGLTLVEIKY